MAAAWTGSLEGMALRRCFGSRGSYEHCWIKQCWKRLPCFQTHETTSSSGELIPAWKWFPSFPFSRLCQGEQTNSKEGQLFWCLVPLLCPYWVRIYFKEAVKTPNWLCFCFRPISKQRCDGIDLAWSSGHVTRLEPVQCHYLSQIVSLQVLFSQVTVSPKVTVSALVGGEVGPTIKTSFAIHSATARMVFLVNTSHCIENVWDRNDIVIAMYF